VTSQQDLHDFLRLNPDFGERSDPEASVREWEAMRSLGRRVFFDQLDENDEHPAQSRADITRRARLAQQQGEVREALLESRFADLNREFGVLPSRTDPDQHRFAYRRERALALGSRVHLAEARENSGSPELAAWMIRERALRAGQLAQDQRPVQRPPAARARVGVER
jgi:hypothetical protein